MQMLYTAAGRNLPAVPWNRYPRPQMQRADWLCLNGRWSLACEHGAVQQILVPFCPESLLSGVAEAPAAGETMVYRRFFRIPDDWQGRRILLHFGAVSRSCTVLVNGCEVCRHDQAYLPFSADITEAVCDGDNRLEVFAVNDLSPKFPRGKQSLRRGGMWYTPCSGIWQTVWLEPVPERYIRRLRIRTGTDFAEISAEGVQDGVIELEDREYPLTEGQVRIPLPGGRLWTPENPQLYFFHLRAGEDAVSSYFALRSLSVQSVRGIPRLCLNGRPYFFNGILDQGYWSDGLYTPASPEGFESDILVMKELGFNTLRKHIKIEPEQFYYDCDRLGMIVFQDMVSSGEYRYLRDTVFPNMHFCARNDRRLNQDPETRKNFRQAMAETVRLLQNHPCICLWTIFNEGWGQFCADDCFRELKMLDPDRFIDSTSGWFHQKESDVDSLHLYFEKLHLGKLPLPQLLSEFGGYSWKVPAHSFNLEKTYGYRKYERQEDFLRALRDLYKNEILPLAGKGLCGAIYTQVSDIEDETNGLLTFDRAVNKIPSDTLSDLAAALQQAVQE
ncbi:MAG: glycoside hydrolase family 2 [Oscillospiraceae bacterium]|nr:glycoside hydrolase family 2 [Oscillospiraceae bacterium]